MRSKAIILAAVCIAFAILVIVLFETPSRKPVPQATKDTVVIDGVLYSTKPTPYGIFTMRFFGFLPDGTLQAESRTLWLLYFNEPTPSNIRAEPSGTIQVLGPPGPGGEMMIDGWLYSQSPTCLTKFVVPPSTILLWTETPGEPIPENAQIQR
jgi:hypothetical protein